MRFGRYGKGQRNVQIQRGTLRVQGIVEDLLRDRGWSEKLHERHVYDVWESVVGVTIAAQSAPVSLTGGILRVDVSHPVVSNELSLMKTKIIEKLKSELGNKNSKVRRVSTANKVVDIRFNFNPRFHKEKLTRSSDKSDTETSKHVKKLVSPEMNEQIEAVVSVVNDLELRDALKTLFLTQGGDTETTE